MIPDAVSGVPSIRFPETSSRDITFQPGDVGTSSSQINRREGFFGFGSKPICIISIMRDNFCITPEELFSKYSLDTVDESALTSEQLGPWVYFIRAKGLGVIKIGFTSNIRSRLTRITDCPAPLELLAVMDGGLKVEREVHEKFAQYRRHLEWFEECGELMSFIRSLPELDCGYPFAK